MLKDEENIKENSFNPILLPRLYERKKYHNTKPYNYFEFLGNKRYFQNKSESKNIFLNTNKNPKFYLLGDYEDNKAINESNSYSYSNLYTNFGNDYNTYKNHNKKNDLIKCFNCGKYGHFSSECRRDLDDICVKCLKDHKGKECPNEKCYLCNRKGHKPMFCPLKKKNQNNSKNKYIASKVSKCTKCLNNGHEEKDCLIRPNDVIIVNTSKKPLCKFCNSPDHYICPFSEDIYVISDYNSDDINLNDTDNDNDNNKDKKSNNNNFKINSYIKNYKVDRNNFDSLVKYFLNEYIKYEKEEVILGKISGGVTKEQIKNTNFCCKCGKPHYSKDCGKPIIKKKYINEENDDYYIRLKNSENLIHKKNPLKFEPFERSEYKINHHDIRYDYYDQNDSSGESFKEMYSRKKI